MVRDNLNSGHFGYTQMSYTEKEMNMQKKNYSYQDVMNVLYELSTETKELKEAGKQTLASIQDLKEAGKQTFASIQDLKEFGKQTGVCTV